MERRQFMQNAIGASASLLIPAASMAGRKIEEDVRE